jgi:nitroreductase
LEHNKTIIETIRTRYSCRSYDARPLDAVSEKKLRDYIAHLNSTVKIKARFLYITENAADETPVKLGTYGMISGAVNFIIGICDNDETDSLAFGYLFEKIILFATDHDLQTCWLGGTFNRADFTQKCQLQDNEYIAIVCPVGIQKLKPRFFDKAVRLMVGANNRKPFSEVFFDQDFATPLNEDSLDDYKIPLEMVRLGPSASNKQPWRIIRHKEGYDFYLKRTKAYPTGKFDMQKNDIGIAMCHFELTAKELGLKGEWDTRKPETAFPDLEYITTWVVANMVQA